MKTKTATSQWHYFVLPPPAQYVLFRVQSTGTDEQFNTTHDNPAWRKQGTFPYTLEVYRQSTYIELTPEDARKRFPAAFKE